jgi:predicted Fe-Mo cluster-binding NifX family protein
MMTGGQPTTIPPMGQATAGMMTGGQPTTIPPMGQATAGMMTGQATAGMPAAGPTNIPPIAYSTQGVTIAGPTNIPPIAYSTQGVTIAGPTSIPPGGRTQPRGQSAAGTTVGGQPTTIPPTGQPAPGALVGGKPDTIPPMGPPTDQGSAAVTVAGSGTIPPLPQSAAGSAGTLLQPGALQGSIDGNCVCPKCGRTVPHVRGTACYTVPCPSCGTPMLREGTVFAPQVTAGSSPAAQLPTVPPLPSSPQWPGLGPGPGALPQMPPLLAPSPPTATPLAPTAIDGPLTVAGDSSGKICIAATGPTIDAQVAPLFGRAPYFLVFGLGTFEVLPNPNVYDRTGVGVQSAQLVVSEGAKAVITYDISVKALEEFQRLRVTVYSGVNGTARDALQWYQAGRLSPASLSDAQAPE